MHSVVILSKDPPHRLRRKSTPSIVSTLISTLGENRTLCFLILNPQTPAAELRASTFAFLERVASYPGVDTVLIARVRILYIRSLIQQSPELKDAVAAPLESFLTVPDFSANPNPNPEVPPGALPPNECFRIDVHLRPAMKRKKSFGFIKEKKGEPEPHLVDGKAEQVKQDAKIYATGNKVRVLGVCVDVTCSFTCSFVRLV
jgi:hypothetical protein